MTSPGGYMLTITGDRDGLIAYLADQAKAHESISRGTADKSAKAREAGIAAGIGEAIEALRQWQDTGEPAGIGYGQPGLAFGPDEGAYQGGEAPADYRG